VQIIDLRETLNKMLRDAYADPSSFAQSCVIPSSSSSASASAFSDALIESDLASLTSSSSSSLTSRHAPPTTSTAASTTTSAPSHRRTLSTSTSSTAVTAAAHTKESVANGVGPQPLPLEVSLEEYRAQYRLSRAEWQSEVMRAEQQALAIAVHSDSSESSSSGEEESSEEKESGGGSGSESEGEESGGKEEEQKQQPQQIAANNNSKQALKQPKHLKPLQKKEQKQQKQKQPKQPKPNSKSKSQQSSGKLSKAQVQAAHSSAHSRSSFDGVLRRLNAEYYCYEVCVHEMARQIATASSERARLLVRVLQRITTLWQALAPALEAAVSERVQTLIQYYRLALQRKLVPAAVLCCAVLCAAVLSCAVCCVLCAAVLCCALTLRIPIPISSVVLCCAVLCCVVLRSEKVLYKERLKWYAEKKQYVSHNPIHHSFSTHFTHTHVTLL